MMVVVLLYGAQTANAQISVEQAFPTITFERPVDLQQPVGEPDKLFVVEQQGRIYWFDKNSDSPEKQLFLDIRDRVNDSGNEEGLLGLAFHPEFQSNGYFYVDYTAATPRRTVIARYSISSENPEVADKSSELVILEVPQPYSNHNAGQLLFGLDGYLYITMGDGGSGGDPENNGQDLTTLLGSILRIDVNATQGDKNYAIPEDNPFVTDQRGFRDEIFAYGLRNPWRLSQDPETGWLWTGDVGQNRFEEIDVIEKGKNYGWNIMEGKSCYNATSCDTTGLTLPIWQYGRSLGQSITGGHVYRGDRLPELVGKYIYADFVTGRIWSLLYDGTAEPENELLLDTNLNISSFGTDQQQHLYMCAFDGNIYRLRSSATTVEETSAQQPQTFQLQQNYPNPFNGSTRISYTLDSRSDVQLHIVDASGRVVYEGERSQQEAGEHSMVWNGRTTQGAVAASGVYLYRLTVNGQSQSKKMLFLR